MSRRLKSSPSTELLDFLEHGSQSPDIKPREAQNIVSSMFRRAWESFCRSKGLYEHLFAAQTAFHVSEAQMPLGRRVSWGQKDQRRSSMLRNSAGGKVWQYGVSASPFFWPYPHFKLKARVLFAELHRQSGRCRHRRRRHQHRLRRTDLQGLAQQSMAWPLNGVSRIAVVRLSDVLSCRSPVPAPLHLKPGRCCSRRRSRRRSRTRWETTQRNPTIPRSARSTRRMRTDGPAREIPRSHPYRGA